MSKKVERVMMSLRMPTDMKAWLAERADENGRSENGEILFILKSVLQADQRQQTAA